MIGIRSYAGYVPRYRLNREVIYKSVGWLNPSTVEYARGEKATANFDEDSITLAVAAAREALAAEQRLKVEGVYFASTTMPYKERLNAGIIAAALGLKDEIRCADFGGSIRSGVTALLSGLEAVESGRIGNLLICSSDCRLGKPSSPQEMIFGDGGAALLVGDEEVIAEYKGSYSITYDFVDHYRGSYTKYDRQWEDRWIRDMGFSQFVPKVVKGLLDKYDLDLSQFSKVIYPCYYAAGRKKLNKILGIRPEVEQDNLQYKIGDTGTPHSLVMLIHALEEAKEGDKILVITFGSGCDAAYFEVTGFIHKMRGKKGLSWHLENKSVLDNYTKYLVWRDILPTDLGLRSEEDVWTRWSSLWRLRKFVLALWGSKCAKCGTVHIPPQRVCVEPTCGAIDQMEDYCFSDKTGRIITYTGDMLAASYNPPSVYAQIEFEGGGKYTFDMTDCELESLAAGMPVGMSFRRKYYDLKRDISGYFWKAVPLRRD